MKGNDHVCQSCGDRNPGPMVKDSIWYSVARYPKSFMCQPCIERLLGRALIREDLVICIFNVNLGWDWTYEEIMTDYHQAI